MTSRNRDIAHYAGSRTDVKIDLSYCLVTADIFHTLIISLTAYVRKKTDQ